MEGFLGNYYVWIKAVHIIFVIFWMAGLFMMPRFFAYHVECEEESAEDTIWSERERRLQKIIMSPAMAVSWVMGLLLVANISFAAGGWLHAKLLLVFLLSGFQGFLIAERKRLAKGNRTKSSKAYRIMNEIPSLAIIIVVILVIVRPF